MYSGFSTEEQKRANELCNMLDNFQLTEEHGFYVDQESGECEQDLSVFEVIALVTADECLLASELDKRFTLVSRAYKYGYMKALGLA